MPTQAEIARAWGTSRAYVNQKVKEGCPLDSFENARLWREAHARRRAPTDRKSLSKLDDEKHSIGTLGTAHSESMEDTLQKTIDAADEAYRLLKEAMLEGKDSKISVRLSVHSKAVEARIKTESMIREEEERRNTLIPLSKAQEITRSIIDTVVKRLISLPQNVAPKVNPGDPAFALEALERESRAIISAAQKAVI